MKRRLIVKMLGLTLLPPLMACQKSGKPLNTEIDIDVVVYSFLDRPILDIYLNQEDLGVASKYGSTSIVTGVTVPMGEQKLSWRLDGPRGALRNGETVSMKNKVVLVRHEIPDHSNYMGIYIYPDETVEFVYNRNMPGNTKRGQAIFDELAKKGLR
jgi:hypothetical protein